MVEERIRDTVFSQLRLMGMSDNASDSAVSLVLMTLRILQDESIVQPRDCKMCGAKSCDESPVPVEYLVDYSEHAQLFDGRLPWLHYV